MKSAFSLTWPCLWWRRAARDGSGAGSCHGARGCPTRRINRRANDVGTRRPVGRQSRTVRLVGVRKLRQALKSPDHGGLSVWRRYSYQPTIPASRLNLTDSSLPAATARALRADRFAAPRILRGTARAEPISWTTCGWPRRRVCGDRKIADLQRVVQTSARKEISRIETRRRPRGMGTLGSPRWLLRRRHVRGTLPASLVKQQSDGDRCDTGGFSRAHSWGESRCELRAPRGQS